MYLNQTKGRPRAHCQIGDTQRAQAQYEIGLLSEEDVRNLHLAVTALHNGPSVRSYEPDRWVTQTRVSPQTSHLFCVSHAEPAHAVAVVFVVILLSV